MSIAITCDMIVAADSSTFGYPEMDVGLLPSIHFNHLHRIVGVIARSTCCSPIGVRGARGRWTAGRSPCTARGSSSPVRASLGAVFAGKSPEPMRLGKAASGAVSITATARGGCRGRSGVSTVSGRPTAPRACGFRGEAQAAMGQDLSEAPGAQMS